MNRAIVFSGSHSRHLYVLSRIVDLFDDVLIILMEREDLIPSPDDNLDPLDRSNFIRHFRDRKEVEIRQYGELAPNMIYGSKSYISVSPDQLNSLDTAKLVSNFDADYCFIFGTNLILDPVLSVLPEKAINLHLGLSPWYRGSATLFWPFYFLEPQFAGYTFHYVSAKPDAGQILHQGCPKLVAGDGIHDVGARCVIAAAESFKSLCAEFILRGNLQGVEQTTSGRVWRGIDFHASHLRLIYNQYNNDIVDHYLEGKLSQRMPKLYSCLPPLLLNQ